MKKIIVLILSLMLVLSFSAYAKKEKTCTTIQDGTLVASDGTPLATGYDMWGYNYQAKLFNGYYCDAYRDAAWCQPYKEDLLSMKWNDAWLSNVDCDGDGKLDRHYGYSSYIGSGAWLTNHQSGEYEGDTYHTYFLNKKETATWTVIEPETYGVMPFNDETYEFEGYGLDLVEYTLLNYGGWNAVQCVGAGTPDEFGYLYLVGDMPEVLLMDPNNEGYEKFWLVPSTTVNCEEERMLSWAPTEFLFDNYGDKTCYWTYFTKIVAAPADAVLEEGVWYAADGTRIGFSIWNEFATIQEVSYDSCDPEFTYTTTEPRPGLGNW